MMMMMMMMADGVAITHFQWTSWRGRLSLVFPYCLYKPLPTPSASTR